MPVRPYGLTGTALRAAFRSPPALEAQPFRSEARKGVLAILPPKPPIPSPARFYQGKRQGTEFTRLKVNLAPLAARPQKAARGVAFQDTGDTGSGAKVRSSPAAGPCRVATSALEHFQFYGLSLHEKKPGGAGPPPRALPFSKANRSIRQPYRLTFFFYVEKLKVK